MTHQSRAALIIFALAAGLASCGKQGSNDTGPYDPSRDPLVNPPSLTQPYPADKPETVNEDETLVRLLEGNPNGMNPIFGSSVYDSYISDLLFEGLFIFDARMNWAVNEAVVESFEESPDHLVNTVKMRPGLKWQDGAPWTAHDCAFSWRAIMDENVPALAVRPGTDEIENVEAVDDLTIRFTHKKALPTNKWNMLFPIIPRHVFDNAAERAKDPSLKQSDYYNKYNRVEVVGNGPYRLVEWRMNDQIVVERWDGYPGPRPHFKKQILKIQADDSTGLLLFKKGDLDEMRLNAQQFATQTNDEAFKKVGVKGWGSSWNYAYVGWNMDGSNPFFTDRGVRRAMAHAMNVPLLIRTLGYNLFEPCSGIFHPESWMYNPEVKRLDFDLAKAAALLDEAGWKLSPRDGLRYKEIDGNQVRFEFELLIPQGSPYGPQVAAVFQQDLKKVGVALKTRILEWATFLDTIQKHEFQAQISAFGTGTDPDTNWNIFHSSEYEKGRNIGKYSNPRVDELFELGRGEFDQDKRAGYYRELQLLIYEDQPNLFLWNRGTTWAFHKRIQGVQFSPREVFGFSPGVSAWWVSKANAMRD